MAAQASRKKKKQDAPPPALKDDTPVVENSGVVSKDVPSKKDAKKDDAVVIEDVGTVSNDAVLDGGDGGIVAKVSAFAEDDQSKQVYLAKRKGTRLYFSPPRVRVCVEIIPAVPNVPLSFSISCQQKLQE